MNQHITIAPNSSHPLTVGRIGYGTMRLPGKDVWGEPEDRPLAIRILQTAIEKGVRYIDTADYYGLDVTNRLIAEALYPYPADLVICTKIGAKRKTDKSWVTFTTPENLRESVDNNLKTLKLEALPLVHFRMINHHNPVPFSESMDAMFELQKEGKIQHVGVSNVSKEQLELALGKGSIASVQNQYSYSSRQTVLSPVAGEMQGGDALLDLCAEHSIAFIPFFTLLFGLDAKPSALDKLAEKYGITRAQANIAWLLHRSPWTLPIPGTSSLDHLLENLDAENIAFSAEDWKTLE